MKNCGLLYPQDFINEAQLSISRNILNKNRDINIYVRSIDLHIDDDLSFPDYIKRMKDQIRDVLSGFLE